MFPILALSSAALYGAADFIGGLTSRRADTIAIVLVSQFAGLMLVIAILAVVATPVPATREWMWGGVAGIAGGSGVALLYRALAIGVMSLVAPVTAVFAVAVPVLAAVLFLGDRPGLLPSVGIALAMTAVVLISQSTSAAARGSQAMPRRALLLALASGIAIGLFFLALARTSNDAGMWPLLFARLSSVTLFLLLMTAGKRPARMSRAVMLVAAAGGVLDMLANLLYLLATRAGPLTIAVTLSSLYPASTVLLARLVLHERLSWRQYSGVAIAIVAILLMVAG